jgi:hypothetical protein
MDGENAWRTAYCQAVEKVEEVFSRACFEKGAKP